MLDENGNVIDLDVIDAIGELPDGRFQVWLQNDRRLITSHPDALEIWRQYIRSRTSDISEASNRVSTTTAS